MRDIVFRLNRAVDSLYRALEEHPRARALHEGSIKAVDLAAYLEQTEHYVSVAPELLRASGVRLLATGRHAALGRLLIQKAKEESGHDAWARRDREALGFGGPGSGPNDAVKAYIAVHRYEATRGSGAAFLGTAYVLEELSARCAQKTVENLLAKSSIPGIEQAVSFLKGHGEEDQAHIEQLATALRGFSDAADRSAILESAHRTRTYFPGFFDAPH